MRVNREATKQAILALLGRNPGGLACANVAKASGVTEPIAYRLLNEMGRAGKCGVSKHGGPGAMWALPEHLPALRQAVAASLDAKQRSADAKERRRREALMRAIEEERLEAAFLHGQRSIVPAGQATPQRPPGPISVFHLAEQMLGASVFNQAA